MKKRSKQRLEMTTVDKTDKDNPRTSLCIVDLHPDVTNAELFDAFLTAGPIRWICVCRDKITKLSLGYGFVKFEKKVDAKRVKRTIDTFKGQPIRIIWLVEDGNVFIRNLDKNMDSKALYDIFSAFGDIVSCKVICDEYDSCGYGFVLFKTEEAARNAILRSKGMLLNGMRVYVSREMHQDDIIKIMADKTKKFNYVYVKNISIKMSEEELKEIFEPYGKITSVKIETDIKSEHFGFGIVCYTKSDDAQKAVEELNGIIIQEKTLYVSRVQDTSAIHEEMIDKNEEIRLKENNQCESLIVLNKSCSDETCDRLNFGTISSTKGHFDSIQSPNFPSADQGCMSSTMTQGVRNVYAPTTVQQIGPIPRWHTQLRQHTPTGGLYNMPRPQTRTAYPATVGTEITGHVNIRMHAAMLVNAYQQEHKQMLGQRLFPLIQMMHPALAGTITQMLLKKDNLELSKMLESKELLEAQVLEIRVVLQAHQTKEIAESSTERGILIHSQEPLTAAMLANAPKNEQKQMLGERLFPLIQKVYPDQAEKITGMLLEMDNLDLLNMLTSKELLEAKVREAITVLHDHNANASTTSTEIEPEIDDRQITGPSPTGLSAFLPLEKASKEPITAAPNPNGVSKQTDSCLRTQFGNQQQSIRQPNMVISQAQPGSMMTQMFPSAGPEYMFPNVSQGQTVFSPPTLMTFPAPVYGQYPCSTNHPLVPRFLQTNMRTGRNFQDNLSENLQRSEVVRPDNVNEDINSAINDIIYEIALRPGNLEETTDLISQILQNCSGDQVLSSIVHVVELLFEKSISEPRFQCVGAKLVKLLSNKLGTVPGFANFKNFVFTRCREECLMIDALLSNPVSVCRLCGFANFITELFLNWEDKTGNVVHRIPVFRFVMRDLLLVLLKHPTDDSVTCATDILKRVGPVIEETTYLNSVDEGSFSEVFLRLSHLELHHWLHETTKCSITTLLKLKSRDWDRTDSSQLRSILVPQNEQADHELEIPIGSIKLENNENESAGKDNQKSGSNMDDKYICKICFDNPVEVTFLPCMHVCCCKNCSDKLKVKQCPICRKKIKESRPLYFA